MGQEGESESIVCFKDVVHDYGSVRALHGVTFQVPKGSIFGMIGPNGSGKSTCLNLLTCLLTPSSGTIRVFGQPTTGETMFILARLGYAPEEAHLYTGLSAAEYVTLSAVLHGMEEQAAEAQANQILATFGLGDRRDDLVGGFSKGMKRKVLLAATLVHDPQLMVLDEPLDGLDVIAQGILKHEIRRRTAAGATVIYSTHILEVLEGLCSHLVLIAEGRMLAVGTPQAVRQTLGIHDYAEAFRS